MAVSFPKYCFYGIILVCLLVSIPPVSAAMTKISPCPQPMDDEITQLYLTATSSRVGEDYFCDANCEKLYALVDKRACELAAQGYCYTCDPTVCGKFGIICKGTGPQPGTQSPPEEPFPWLVVVGGLAVVGIGALAVLKGLGKKKPGEKDKKDQGPEGYILQISPTDTIKVSTKERGSFTATAWKVGENGALSRAGNASITLVPPRDVPGLSVVPGSGKGSLNVSVSLEKPATVGSAKIQVNASAGGKGISTFVTVNFEGEANIEFD